MTISHWGVENVCTYMLINKTNESVAYLSVIVRSLSTLAILSRSVGVRTISLIFSSKVALSEILSPRLSQARKYKNETCCGRYQGYHNRRDNSTKRKKDWTNKVECSVFPTFCDELYIN